MTCKEMKECTLQLWVLHSRNKCKKFALGFLNHLWRAALKRQSRRGRAWREAPGVHRQARNATSSARPSSSYRAPAAGSATYARQTESPKTLSLSLSLAYIRVYCFFSGGQRMRKPTSYCTVQCTVYSVQCTYEYIYYSTTVQYFFY